MHQFAREQNSFIMHEAATSREFIHRHNQAKTKNKELFLPLYLHPQEQCDSIGNANHLKKKKRTSQQDISYIVMMMMMMVKT